jgi:hypothetical protein
MEENFDYDVKPEDCEKTVVGDTTWTKVVRTGKKVVKAAGLIVLGVGVGLFFSALGKSSSEQLTEGSTQDSSNNDVLGQEGEA